MITIILGDTVDIMLLSKTVLTWVRDSKFNIDVSIYVHKQL